jgi:hypothetical protein
MSVLIKVGKDIEERASGASLTPLGKIEANKHLLQVKAGPRSA